MKRFLKRLVQTMEKTIEKKCSNCDYYSRYEGVCCNGDSEYRADFTEIDFVCDEWTEKQDDNLS